MKRVSWECVLAMSYLQNAGAKARFFVILTHGLKPCSSTVVLTHALKPAERRFIDGSYCAPAAGNHSLASPLCGTSRGAASACVLQCGRLGFLRAWRVRLDYVPLGRGGHRPSPVADRESWE